ncbi:MAG: NADPH-dependent 7-cyano-7-deazaguanine reductase QueF [Planctomycetota bacterium]|nr:MAG: NADPH-dependent 7-cyano-7-deazaguanine reductase QueF [Planctomycetota bacterium]
MPDATLLETFANPHPSRDYLIEHVAHEFTSLCPKTGQPDFAELFIRYAPGPRCVELKSLKLYLQAFRNEGIFYEDVTNRILDDLVKACEPKWMSVRSVWTVRGGIHSEITAEHGLLPASLLRPTASPPPPRSREDRP